MTDKLTYWQYEAAAINRAWRTTWSDTKHHSWQNIPVFILGCAAYWHFKGLAATREEIIIGLCFGAFGIGTWTAIKFFFYLAIAPWRMHQDQSQKAKDNIFRNSTLIVGDPRIVADGAPDELLCFIGTFTKRGELAKVFVEFEYADREDVQRLAIDQLGYPRRVHLGEFKNFMTGEEIRLAIIAYENLEQHGTLLRFGNSLLGPSIEVNRFTLTDPINGRIVISTNDNKEQFYNFMLRPKIDRRIELWHLADPTFQPIDLVKIGHNNITLITESMMNFPAGRS